MTTPAKPSERQPIFLGAGVDCTECKLSLCRCPERNIDGSWGKPEPSEASRKEAEEVFIRDIGILSNIEPVGPRAMDAIINAYAAALHAREQEIGRLSKELEIFMTGKVPACVRIHSGEVHYVIDGRTVSVSKLKEQSALVSLLSAHIQKELVEERGPNAECYCSGRNKPCSVCFLEAPSLAPALERRRLEREVIEAAKLMTCIGGGHGSINGHLQLQTALDALSRLDAQGKEKGK